MKYIKFLNSGKITLVENNIAHQFIDRKLAVLVKKEVEEPVKDKMISNKRSKIRKK